MTRALQRLPTALTSAVLAGVLLPFCLAAALPAAGRSVARRRRYRLLRRRPLRCADAEPGGHHRALTYLALGALSPLVAGLIAGTDPRLVATAAGLGLFGAFTGAAQAAQAALDDPRHRVPASIVLLIKASGVTALGLGSAPLGLAAGLLVLALLRVQQG